MADRAVRCLVFSWQLLNRKAEKRLGAKEGAAEIKRHPFFSEVNWEDVKNRRLALKKPLVKDFEREYFSYESVYGQRGMDPTADGTYDNWSFIGS